MAMNKQRKSSNLINILSYDDAGNIVLRDYSQTIRYNWNGTIHAFTGPLSISSVAAAVTDTDRFLVSDGGVLKYRTGAEVLSDIGAIGGSGVTGQVAYWNGTNSQTGSNNLFWDAANSRLGIGTNAPASSFQIGSQSVLGSEYTARIFGNNQGTDNQGNANLLISTVTASAANRGGSLAFGGNNGVNNFVFARISGRNAGSSYAGYLLFETVNSSGAFSEAGRFTPLGNLNLGTFTSDGGQRLQVQGTTLLNGAVGIGSTTSASFALSINKNIEGAVTSYGSAVVSTVQSGVTTGARIFYSEVGTQATTFTLFELNHFYSVQGVFGLGSTVVNQYGYRVHPNLIGAVNNFGFYGDIPSGTGRWNLYMAGTANNYLAGKLVIGTTTVSTFTLDVNGTARVSGDLFGSSNFLNRTNSGGYFSGTSDNFGFWYTGSVGNISLANAQPIVFSTANTERLRLDSSGNLGLGVVPSAWYSTGFKSFQMNGGGYAVMSGNGEAYHANNAYFDTTIDWKYYANGTATRYDQRAGQHIWYNAPSGTAGNSISFTQAMTLTSGGNLLVGTTTDAGYKLNVNGTSRFSQQSIFFAQAYVSKVLNSATIVNSSTDASVLLFAPTTTNNYGGVIGWAEGGAILAASISAYDDGSGGALGLSFATGNNTALAERLKITSTGAATFSSSVTATNAVFDRVANDSGSILRIGNATTYYDFSRNASTGALSIQGNQTGANNIIIAPTSGNLLVGTTVDQGYRVQITSASADSQLNVWGATAPSIRLDNAASGATQRFVIGLATATNNFIQGANAGDVCMTPGTSSALVFGMWQTSSSSEVMRISTSSNVLIGTSTDVGAKLRVVGDISASVDLRLTRTGTSPAIILDQTQLRLVNQTSGFTIGLNVENDIIRFGGAIRTTPPAGSGNPEYKLGSYSATAPTATGYLNIEVGGVVYKVLAST